MRAGPKLCLAEPAREARPVPAFPVLWNGAVLRRRSPISRPMQLTNKMVASRPLDPRQQSAHVGELLMINRAGQANHPIYLGPVRRWPMRVPRWGQITCVLNL